MRRKKTSTKQPRKLASGGYAGDYSGDYSDSEDYQNYGDYGDEAPDDGSYSSTPDDYTDAGVAPQSSAGGYASAPENMNEATMAPFRAQQAKQQDALQLLRDAQKRAVDALNPKQDKSAMWLAIAQGLLSPTRTGNSFESLGNAAGGAAPYMQHYADVDTGNKAKIADMDYGLAQSLYNDAIKPQQIIDWYARSPEGTVGKQKAVVVDGVPVPFGEILTPQTRPGAMSRSQMVDWYNRATPQERAAYDRMYAPKANQSTINVQNSVPYETQDQKNAADTKKDMAAEAYKSLNLSNQLNAVLPEIQKTPKAYFGPGGPGLVYAGKAMKQLGFDVGEGLDSASFISSIMSHLGPAQRIVGSGSSSDRDVALFMNSLPGLTQTKEGNIALVKYYQKMAQYNRKLVQIMNRAADRGDFYGMDDQASEEINKLGRIFTDQEASELQQLGGGAPSKTPKNKIPHADVQEDDQGITLDFGGGN